MSEFRFAIMGAGNIAHRFAGAVRLVEGCALCAVASSSGEKARAFAEKEGIPAYYASYEEMLIKEKPDCVYIATIPSAHLCLAEMCANHGTGVLCEKAMFMDYEEAAAFAKLAEEKGVFWMEAMWSRFLPANLKAKEWIKSGAIGRVCWVDAQIGFKADASPEGRYLSPQLGGGAARDITVYAYEISSWLLDSREESSAVCAAFSESGVDVIDAALIKLENGVPVTIKTSFISRQPEELTVQGTEGAIVIPHPHYANSCQLYRAKGGEVLEEYTDETTQNGFTYEVKEVMRCIKAGLKESPVVPHSDTLDFARLTSRIFACK